MEILLADSSPDEYCGAVSTTFWQPSSSGPVMQVITLEEQQSPIVWFQFGGFFRDFSTHPIMPGASVELLFPVQTGCAVPYAVGLMTGGVEGGALSGLQQLPTSVEGGADMTSWGRVKTIYR